MIKALVSMKRGRLPGLVHFEQLSPLLDLSASPFFVTAENTEWPQSKPRWAGVSSFGFGGSGAHVVLEEAPAPSEGVDYESQLILLSARDPERLAERVKQLIVFLETEQGRQAPLAQLALSLRVGRLGMAARLFTWVENREQLLEKLAGFPDHNEVKSAYKKPKRGGTRLKKPRVVDLDQDWRVLAERWLQGENPDWSTAATTGMRRLSLPTYPFCHKRYWITDPV